MSDGADPDFYGPVTLTQVPGPHGAVPTPVAEEGGLPQWELPGTLPGRSRQGWAPSKLK